MYRRSALIKEAPESALAFLLILFLFVKDELLTNIYPMEEQHTCVRVAGTSFREEADSSNWMFWLQETC